MQVLRYIVIMIGVLVPVEAQGNDDCVPLSTFKKSYIDHKTDDHARLTGELYDGDIQDCYTACCNEEDCNVVAFDKNSLLCTLILCTPADACTLLESNGHTVTFLGDPSASTIPLSGPTEKPIASASKSDTSLEVSNSEPQNTPLTSPSDNQQTESGNVSETTTMSPLETSLTAPDVNSTKENTTTLAMSDNSTKSSISLPPITEAFSFSEASLTPLPNISSQENTGAESESTILLDSVEENNSLTSSSFQSVNVTDIINTTGSNNTNNTSDTTIVSTTVGTFEEFDAISTMENTITSISKISQSTSSNANVSETSNVSTILQPNTTINLSSEQSESNSVEQFQNVSSSTKTSTKSALASSRTTVSPSSAPGLSENSSSITSKKGVTSALFKAFTSANTQSKASNNSSSSSNTTFSSKSSIAPSLSTRRTIESLLPVSEKSSTTMSPNETAPSQGSGVGDSGEFQPLSAGLIAALSIGIIFFFAIMVLLGKRLFDSWHRRHYNRIDYLINGMYN